MVKKYGQDKSNKSSLGTIMQDNDTRKFEDDDEERAWVAFMAALVAHSGIRSDGNHTEIAASCDSLLALVRERRSVRNEGPYRG